ncbi:hypothetical protein SO802_018550 [Lithocarpus litseifolius]|uniref:DDE Tnp4 domain-containing protein n=1 Tax=Lithocarpus litseifolius TaxID=425828 RepID=A0AAW2CN22_9ROSI
MIMLVIMENSSYDPMRGCLEEDLKQYNVFQVRVLCMGLMIMELETKHWFCRQDCIGAIDGTHVRASMPPEIQGRFRGRKDGTTQNVLAAISFDLKFTYVLARWEGSAHDSRVLNDAFARLGGFSILEGKYYLGDAGCGNKNGILSPYRSVRYHLKEFSDHPSENEHELLNLCHSSL